MNAFFTRIISVFTSVITMLTAVLFPQSPVIPEYSEPKEYIRTEFDEGEFIMNENDLIVSPHGNDNNSGTIDKPLKSIEKAKEILKENTAEDAQTVTVWFREGTYTINNTVEFDSSDRTNVIYRSYPGEKVVFSGAEEISGNWNETEINGVRAFVTDISVEDDEDYFNSLFKGNKRLSRSVYPKNGVFKVINPKEDEAIPSEWSPEFFLHSAVFYADKNDILDFANPQDVEIKIMHYWCDEHLPIHSVNIETGRIETAKPTSMRIRVDDNFIYENVKEALSLPGEWYLDRTEDRLYYIPEDGDTVSNTVLYAGKTEKLISINKTENITFQGIEFSNTDWEHIDGSCYGKVFDESHPLYSNIKYGAVHPQAAFEVPATINVSDSSGINFTDCRFENLSLTAVRFENASKDCNITSCMFNEIGANAVFIHGDFTVPATTENINVTDCHISRYGRIFNNAIGILLTHAINCNLSNNEIHDGWYTGISVGWNWGYSDNSTNNIKICNNLIYNIGNGWLSDMGGIYTLGIQPDTVIKGNIIYNVGCYGGTNGYGGWGIYLDEGSSGILVEENLVYDCSSQTFHQHYGKDNIIRNNIFAFGKEGAFRITRNEEHNSLTLTNNILITDNATMYAQTTELDWFVDESNLYWDYKNGGNVFSGDSMSISERKNMVIMTARGYYNNATFADPLFKDAENRDFTLAINSPSLETGFIPWEYKAGTKTLFN